MKPITPADLCELALIDDVRVSPDGAMVVFTISKADWANNAQTSHLWGKSLHQAESPAHMLTRSGKDSAPRWSAHGALAFLSARGEKAEVYQLPHYGEAYSVAAHANGITAFAWSPDGRHIAFCAPMRADECATEDQSSATADDQPSKDAWTLRREKEQRQHEEEQRLDPRRITRIPYRTGTKFIDDRFTHIYVAEAADPAHGKRARPRRLTPNDTAFNFSPPRWSADGRYLYTTYTRDPDSGELFRYTDIVRFDTHAAKRAFTRLALPDYSCYDPLPSPDGRWLAFLRSLDDPQAYQPATLAIARVEGDTLTLVADLTAALDRTVGDFRWSADGQWLYFTINADGRTNLWRASLADPAQPQLEQLTFDDHEINSFDVTPDGCVVFAASTPQDPSALYLLAQDGSVHLLHQPNAELLRQRAVGNVETLRYTCDGRSIQGWLFTPADFDPRRRYPLIVQMHGGPHIMWGAATRSMWHEVQAMLSAGYLVFYCNPRGSDGYGRAFWHANRADWGDGPMRDVLTGVDVLCERPYVDRSRLYLTGGSYAGYLTVWIIGRDARFAAACAQRGVYNLVSMRNTTDVPFFNDREAGGITPWDDVEALWRMSPISLAPHIRTPLLIEHSELDYRVPIEQAEQLFQAMKLMKKEVKLIRWPREGHELSRSGEPKHRVERIQAIIEWFNQH